MTLTLIVSRSALDFSSTTIWLHKMSELHFFLSSVVMLIFSFFFFFFSSRRRHTRSLCDWSSDVCSSDLLFEVFVFLAWSVALIYMLVGPAYRLSLMGAFTAPLVLILQGLALLAPIDVQIGRASCRERV